MVQENLKHYALVATSICKFANCKVTKQPYTRNFEMKKPFILTRQGGRSWQPFGHRKKSNQSYRRACICKFLRQKRRICKFLRQKQHICKSTKAWSLLFKSLREHDIFRWNLYESMIFFVEISTKAWYLSLKSLQKHRAFPWNLYESIMSFIKISMKAILKARKSGQNVKNSVCWEPSLL